MPGGLGAFALALALAALALTLLLVWILARDRGVARTSFGFYVERRRYPAPPAEQQTVEHEPPSHGWPSSPAD